MARLHLPKEAVSAIKGEIETGLTFARIASTAADEKKIARDTANARKAYQTACAWAEKTFLNPTDSKEIQPGLLRLKVELLKLNVLSLPSKPLIRET